MLTAEHAVVTAVLLCIAGAGVSVLLSRRTTAAGWFVFAVTAGAAGLVLAAVGRVVITGAGHPTQFLALPLLGFALRLHIDGLSALFLLLAAVVAVPASLFSIGYFGHQQRPEPGRYYPWLLLFLAALFGLLSTTDMMWFFFVFWQMMTVAGYALIRYDRDNPACPPAARKYFVLMQIACAATMIGAEILAAGDAGSAAAADGLKYDFDTVSARFPGLFGAHPGWTALAFGLFVVGFGIKLGMWPFGRLWLPDAHPAAPSPVSALLSGVMIKTGLYGLIRYFLWLVPAEVRSGFPLVNWGLVLAALGTITLLTGTAQALGQVQAKRLLACSSIGQGGYMLLGLGTCLTLLGSTGRATEALAAAALIGTLFHALNHAVFKGLLFLNAGSVVAATGTQDFDRLGGLARALPVTAVTAGVACAALAGVPISSGFASKWSLFSAAMAGGSHARFLPLAVAVAILTSALTLAVCVKFHGAIFLGPAAGRSRGDGHANAAEGGWLMRGPQLFLALLCVLAGVFPGLVVQGIVQALGASRSGLGALLADAAAPPVSPWTGLGAAGSGSLALYAPLVLALVMVLILAFTRWLATLGGAARRTAAPWLCGYAAEPDVNRFRAAGWFSDIRRGLARLRIGTEPGGAPIRPSTPPRETNSNPCSPAKSSTN
jgi:formate hydrogenlyase subunit 3/multisubunit Na+/H+ antiporter MnhD subunit